MEAELVEILKNVFGLSVGAELFDKRECLTQKLPSEDGIWKHR
jgi:hypothetical protein